MMLFPEFCGGGDDSDSEKKAGPTATYFSHFRYSDEEEQSSGEEQSCIRGTSNSNSRRPSGRNIDVPVSVMGGWRHSVLIDSSVSGRSQASSDSGRHYSEKDGDQLAGHDQGSTSTGIPSELRSIIVREFQKTHLKNIILHDVYSISNQFRAQARLAAGVRRSTKNAFCIVAYHGDHFHVVHDCSFQSNQCRCAYINKITSRFGQRLGRRSLPRFQFSFEHAEHSVLYMEKGSRLVDYLQIGGRQWTRSSCEARLIRLCGVQGSEQRKLLENSDIQDTVQCFLGCPDGSGSKETAEGDWKGIQAGNVGPVVGARRPGATLLHWFDCKIWTAENVHTRSR
uniref:Uncharacterized protein n=1 Tax=Cacopsylla melanoneura TaxID=428564 RepID=A0A8D8T7C2_9HEMI